jgi:pectinesterase
MKPIFILLAILPLTALRAQQTSTDTTWKIRYYEQHKADSHSPLPPAWPKTLTVAQDGSGDYKTIQEAVNAVRDLSQEQVTIYIRKGIYHEKLVIPSWKTKISLVGDSNATTIITNKDFSGKEYPGGRDAFGRSKYSTYTSFTVLVQGDDFTAENLTIENTSGRVGQAVALHVEADRCIFRNCRLLGNQDTLYAATGDSRQYYKDCFIEGTTDFIFGEATAVFQDCTIRSLTNSFVTAAATTPGQRFGYVFLGCKLIADTGKTKCYLGRPWRPDARVVFINSVLGGHILPAGWDNWNKAENEKTVFYAEYNNAGPGAASGKRVGWSRQLTAKEARAYTLRNIFGGWSPL